MIYKIHIVFTNFYRSKSRSRMRHFSIIWNVLGETVIAANKKQEVTTAKKAGFDRRHLLVSEVVSPKSFKKNRLNPNHWEAATNQLLEKS